MMAFNKLTCSSHVESFGLISVISSIPALPAYPRRTTQTKTCDTIPSQNIMSITVQHRLTGIGERKKISDLVHSTRRSLDWVALRILA